MKTCKIEGCEREHYAHGYCNMHWQRIKNDNRVENLELWANKHASGQRVSDLQEFATEIAFEYGLVGALPY